MEKTHNVTKEQIINKGIELINSMLPHSSLTIDRNSNDFKAGYYHGTHAALSEVFHLLFDDANGENDG